MTTTTKRSRQHRKRWFDLLPRLRELPDWDRYAGCGGGSEDCPAPRGIGVATRHGGNGQPNVGGNRGHDAGSVTTGW